jgi:hypothetical protein
MRQCKHLKRRFGNRIGYFESIARVKRFCSDKSPELVGVQKVARESDDAHDDLTTKIVFLLTRAKRGFFAALM